MKQVFCLLSLFILSILHVSAQNVAYILPDIGSPGMNTYVEIISHVDSVGTYGPDKTYWGDVSDNLKLVFENPNDTNDIVVGPLIVSWDGRLISTQIFVNPDVNPNSSDWELLNTQFNKRFAVEYNGNKSSYQDFYVLNPTHVGNVVSNSERYLGEGALGKRSPRGAMIVDSLILADDRYYPSLKDCDLSTPGNQAYLPLVIMAKYKIKGAVNTVIDMQGGKRGQNTEIQDAGPGGGGGGGAFEDVNTDRSSGKRAGNGFTCGGFGGANTFLSGKTGYWVNINLSNSTNQNGYSLNGVMGGETKTFCAESSGGGTGHPFGKAGEGCDGQDDKSKIGYYGGGSGYSNDENGGSAGYGKAGTGPGNTGGKIHGNPMIIPLAGGSGGASGNPQPEFVENEWSGSGGGGGGALRLYAREIIGLDIPALGGEGGNADDAEGGNGSGGAIELSANTTLSDIITNVSGYASNGYTGGAGYIKVNAADKSAVIDNTGGGLPIYNSVSSDSLQYVPRLFTLEGTKGTSKDVKLMFKVGHEPWQDITSSATINNTDWSVDFDLTPYMSDKYFYFYAFQDETGVGANQYLNIPDGVLSQSAANIFIPVDEPMLDGDKSLYMTVNACPGDEITDSLYLWNIGAVPVDLDFSGAMFVKNTSGLELASPVNDLQLIKHKDSQLVKIKYTYQSGANGPIYDTLLIPHNDMRTGIERPWRVAVTIFIEEYDYTILDEYGKSIEFKAGDELNLGQICRDGTADKSFYINNNNDARLTFVDFGLHSGNKGFEYIVLEPGPLDKDEKASVLVKYDDASQPKTGMEVKDTLYFTLAECPSIKDSVIVSISFLYSTLSVVEDFNFGAVRVGETLTKTATIENIGNADAYIPTLPAVNVPFLIIATSPSPLPVTLKPGETLQVTMEYAPTVESVDDGKFTIDAVSNGNTCDNQIDLNITASSFQSAIILSKDSLNFGIVAECNMPADTLLLSNNVSASGDLILNRNPEIIGKDASYFFLKKHPIIPTTLTPGKSSTFIVEFNSPVATKGLYEAELLVYTDEPNRDSVIVIPITAERDEIDFTFGTINNPFATIETAVPFNTQIDITNNSKLSRNVYAIYTNTTEAVVTPNSYLFAPGETKQFDLDINYTDTTDLSLEVKLYTDNPCTDSISTQLNFEVEYGLAEIEAALDLNVLAPCNIHNDTIYISNIGTADIEWRGISLTNTDFTIIEEPVLPLNLAPDDSSYIIVEFDANGKADGEYSVDANFIVYEYGTETQHTSKVTATIQSALFATPSMLQFGNVIEKYQSDVQTLGISNIGAFDVVILEVNFPTSTDYELSIEELFADGPAVNYPLPVGDSISYNLAFTPYNIQSYSGTIEIIVQYSDCIDTILVDFTAEGVPDNILELTLPNLTVDPALSSIKLPLQAKTSKFEIESALDSLTITFDRNVIKILGVENASYRQTQGLDTIVVIFNDSTNYVIDTVQTTIATIHAMPLLGHIESTDLLIHYIPKTGEKISQVVENNGNIALDICKEGGDRLLAQANRTDLIITPNPAGKVIKIKMFLQEIGNYSLKLFDLSGKLFYENTIENTIFAGTEKSLQLSTESIGTGEYMMMLISPSQSISKKVVVIK